MHDFKAGWVLRDTFQTLVRNVLPFGIMALVCGAVIHGLGVALGPLILSFAEGDAYPSVNPSFFSLLLVLILLCLFGVTAMVSYGTYQDLLGRPIRFAACVGRGLALILPVSGAAILVIVITAPLYLALILPGVLATLVLYVFIPVAVIERPGVVATLKRSRDLTRGHLLPIFVILLVLGLADAVAAGLAWLILPFMGSPATLVLELLVQSLSVLLFAVTPTVAYVHLRRAGEGTAAEAPPVVSD